MVIFVLSLQYHSLPHLLWLIKNWLQFQITRLINWSARMALSLPENKHQCSRVACREGWQRLYRELHVWDFQKAEYIPNFWLVTQEGPQRLTSQLSSFYRQKKKEGQELLTVSCSKSEKSIAREMVRNGGTTVFYLSVQHGPLSLILFLTSSAPFPSSNLHFWYPVRHIMSFYKFWRLDVRKRSNETPKPYLHSTVILVFCNYFTGAGSKQKDNLHVRIPLDF